jgi:integrase
MRLRGRVYHADFCAGGRRIRKRLSTNLKAATEILNDLRARADRADFNLLDNDYPLADLKVEFVQHCRQTCRPASVHRYEVCLANILPRMAATRVNQISTDNLRAYRQDRLNAGASPQTINMEVGVLSRVLRWAVAEGKIGSNPVGRFRPLRHDNPKEGRALSPEEVTRLLARSQQPWRDIWYAYLTTGMRRSELSSLTFADIDWENRKIIVRGSKAKNHRERRLPIDRELWDILCRHAAGREARQPGTGFAAHIDERIRERFTKDHVFVTSANTPIDLGSNLYNAFLRYCKRANIQTQTFDAEGNLVEHVDLHSLRRTFATNLIANGVNPKSVQKLLGHRTLAMTMNLYAKVHAETDQQAIGKLSYGHGATSPDHVVEFAPSAGFPVQDCHKSVTTSEERAAI